VEQKPEIDPRLKTSEMELSIEEQLKKLKVVEQALRTSELNLNEAQHLAHMCSFIFDFEKNSFEWSKEFLNIFEIDTQSNFPSIEKMMDLVYPEDRQYVKETVGNAIENKMESLQMEYRIVTGKGTVKYVNYRGKLSYNENGKHTKRFGTIIDITERKIQELELRRTLEKLERSNKDLEQFAYVSSHDLQEPLRMVSIYSKILQNNLHGTLNEKNDQYLEILIEGSKRIHSLITGLLEYSNITSTKEELIHVDMNNVVNTVLKDLSSSIDETKAEVVVENLPSVKANPIQMRSLMLNLISNAIKFTEKNVKPCIEIKGEKKERSVVYSVKDNGIGINPEDFERIFVIFHRLHAREIYSGTGIGLSICKRIVESHGGRIWIESESGKGATFYFSLPA
jgi:signal transduction histidine kinase